MMAYTNVEEFYNYYKERDQAILASFNHSLLAPCQHCAGPVIMVEDTDGLNTYRGGVAIDCNDCRARTTFMLFRTVQFMGVELHRPDFSATLDAWNRRATKMKPALAQELLHFAREFVQNYITQNNRCTAWPYAYVVQKQVTRLVPPGYGHEPVYRLPVYSVGRYGDDRPPFTEEEIPAIEKEHGRGWKIDVDDCEHIGDQNLEWEDVQWFFTQAAANDYVAQDKHNLGTVQDYVKHFRWNNEAELILKVMFALAGENYNQHKR